MNTAIQGDLHFHSTDSDGVKTNGERIYQIGGIDPTKHGVWAMTNHDRFSPSFVEPARDEGIQAIWATEISAHSDELDTSLHITCYAPTFSDRISLLIDEVINGRRQKIVGQVAKLREKGFPITEEDLYAWIREQKMSPENATNWHIVQYLWKHGATRSLVHELTRGSVDTDEGFMRECLRENGDFAEIGYYPVPPYEPELSLLAQVAESEGAILSVAHPNFSFRKKLLVQYGSMSIDDDVQLFAEKIVPVILDLGVKNFEVNALANEPWVQTIAKVTKRAKGIITFGSDNHGLDEMTRQHGVLGRLNPLLTEEMMTPIQSRLRGFL